MNGYKNFICLNGIYLNHSLGITIEKRYFFKKIEIKNYHNYIRTYYMVRNRLYVYRKYHEINELAFFKFYILDIYHMFFFIIKKKNNKIKELRSYFLGIKDFLLKNMGKKEFKY